VTTSGRITQADVLRLARRAGRWSASDAGCGHCLHSHSHPVRCPPPRKKRITARFARHWKLRRGPCTSTAWWITGCPPYSIAGTSRTAAWRHCRRGHQWNVPGGRM